MTSLDRFDITVQVLITLFVVGIIVTTYWYAYHVGYIQAEFHPNKLACVLLNY